MKTTIDKAGRVVIPASLRAKAGLTPGTELEVVLDDLSIRLVRTAPPPEVVERGPRHIVRATSPDAPEVDVAALVEEERDRWQR